MGETNRSSDSIPVADLAAEATNDGSPAQSIPEAIPPHARRVSNVNYKEVKATATSAWQEKAEEHAANETSFMIRPFNKQTHWPFLEDLCKRYDLFARFDAREKSAYFDSRSKG